MAKKVICGRETNSGPCGSRSRESSLTRRDTRFIEAVDVGRSRKGVAKDEDRTSAKNRLADVPSCDNHPWPRMEGLTMPSRR